jgi:hypothetical protein
MADLSHFPYGSPIEEAQRAREAAIGALVRNGAILPEHCAEVVETVLEAALPHFRFYPLGDNHHNAALCPYCSPTTGVDKVYCTHNHVDEQPDSYRRCISCGLVLQLPITMLEAE